MKILITNDDGIRAETLPLLIEWAKKLGEVVVAAPKTEQSGRSHSIELHKSFEVLPSDLFEGIEAYSVDSSPADCVRYATVGLGHKFDLVISGVNKGYNMGCDMVYSGTLGAVFEASFIGFENNCRNVNAIALSSRTAECEDAIAQLDTVWKFITDNDLFKHNKLYNINIPSNAKGIRITRQGGIYYSDTFEPVGNNEYMPTGYLAYKKGDDLNIDTDAVANGYISITPITVSCTFDAAVDELSHLNDKQ